MFKEEDKKNAADSGEVEVVDQEQSLELERLTVAHVFPPAENYGIVDDNEDARLLERRHWGPTGLESEVLGRVAGDGLEGLAENGP